LVESGDYTVVSGRCAHDVVYKVNKIFPFGGGHSYISLPFSKQRSELSFTMLDPPQIGIGIMKLLALLSRPIFPLNFHYLVRD
jgi:hypothetical protein